MLNLLTINQSTNHKYKYTTFLLYAEKNYHAKYIFSGAYVQKGWMISCFHHLLEGQNA